MKKISGTGHNTIINPPFRVYKFTGEDELSDEHVFHASKSFHGIINYKTMVAPLYVQPFDHRINRVLKRITDILFSLFVIFFILLWLIPIVAFIIKLNSKGPVFFLQKRNKKNGELFNCIKFRSMLVNAHADIMPAKENDDRITTIGKFLRRYHIDELPQVFNVLIGDMSLIGPRPHMIYDNLLYDSLIKNYSYRYKAKPGITGLAQVMGYKGPTSDIQKMEKRINMDIFYVRHWSLKLDMVILYRTIFNALV